MTSGLAKQVLPRDGESLSGLVERIAIEHGARLNDVAVLLGLGSKFRNRWEHRDWTTLTPAEATAFSEASRVPERLVRATLPSQHFPFLSDLQSDNRRRAHQMAHVDVYRRSWCPRCLGSPEPAWSFHWTFSVSFACLRHGTVLASRCGSCGKHPTRMIGEPTTVGDCPSAHARVPRCNASLADAAAVRAPERMLAAQRRLWVALTSGSAPMFGVHVPASTVMQATVTAATDIAVVCHPEMVNLVNGMPGADDALDAVVRAAASLHGERRDGNPLNASRRSVHTAMRQYPPLAAAAFTVAAELLLGDDWADSALRFVSLRTRVYGADRTFRRKLSVYPEPANTVFAEASRRYTDLGRRIADPKVRSAVPHGTLWSAGRCTERAEAKRAR